MKFEGGVEVDVATGEEAVWRLVTSFAGALTPFELAEALVRDGGAAAGGTFANMAILDPDGANARIVHRSISDASVAPRWSALDLDDDVLACEAIRTGLPVLLGSPEEIVARFPRSEVLDAMGGAGLAARASVPVRSALGTTLGAIGFGWQQPQGFDAVQLRRVDLIAHLTGLALERAILASARDGSLPRALETMPNAFFAIDAEFAIRSVNREAETILAAARADLVGRNVLDLFPEATARELDGQFRTALTTRRPVSFETYVPTLAAWYGVSAWPDDAGLNVSLTNISQRRSAEVERTIALNEATQAHAHLRFLTRVSSALASASTRSEVFERLSRTVIPDMADWCTVVVPSRSELVRVAAAHVDPTLDGLAQRLVGSYPHSFDGPSPGVAAYSSGQPLRLQRLAQEIISDLDTSAASVVYGRTLELLGDGPGLIMPIIHHGEVAAVLTSVRADGNVFGDDDVETMHEVVALVAAALDDAEQAEAQRETADALQAAALPRELPTFDRVELAAGYRPATRGAQVGGDWYDAFVLETGRIALIVGDAAGHGLQAASMMTQMRNALRAHLYDSFSPAESLRRLSHQIANQDADAFATIICVEIDPHTGQATWASAGHPAPIHVRSNGPSSYLRFDQGPPIGWSEADSPRLHGGEHRLILEPGDRLLMFTDGLVERRGVDFEIGLTHLMFLAESTHRGDDPATACDAILDDMLATSHDDDVCLLVVDYRASAV